MDVQWPIFLALVLVSYISPGPDTVVILRSSAESVRSGLLASAGALCGLTVHMMISAVGLSAVLVAVPGSLTVVSLVGALYLAYLGVGALRAGRRVRRLDDGGRTLGGTAQSEHPGWGAFRRALVTNVTNPKVILFFVAVLPQFVDEASGWPVGVQLGILGAADVIMGVIYLPLFVLFGSRVLSGLRGRGLANLELVVGVLLLVFAGGLVLDTMDG